MPLPTFNEFRALGHMGSDDQPIESGSDTNSELLELLARNAQEIRKIFNDAIHSDAFKEEHDLCGDLKTIMARLSDLHNRPASPTNRKVKDPMSNVVSRSFTGPDSSGDSGGGD